MSTNTKRKTMFVRPEMIAAAHETAHSAEPREVLELLRKREPVLASWVEHQLLVISGKMGLCGARRRDVAEAHEDFLQRLQLPLSHFRPRIWPNGKRPSREVR